MKKIERHLQGLWKYRELLSELISRDIKVRYRRSVLGLLWTLLNPILMMTVMTLVFSNLFSSDIEYFHIYYFTGYILFSFTTEATNGSLGSIVDNGNLIKKVYVPKYIFPLSKALSSLVNLFFSTMAMLIVILVTGVPIYATILLVPIVVFYALVFSVGLGLILATSEVFFRDTRHLYGIITLIWMYMTPIFYPSTLLLGTMPIVLKLNPLSHFVEFMRNVILYNTVPSIKENLMCAGVSLIFLLLGIYLFQKKQNKFILYI